MLINHDHVLTGATCIKYFEDNPRILDGGYYYAFTVKMVRANWNSKQMVRGPPQRMSTYFPPYHTAVLWLICRHRGIENSTYMKVIFTKNLTFINIICHTKFWFAKMYGSLWDLLLKSSFILQWNLVIVNSVLSPILFTNERCLLFSM